MATLSYDSTQWPRGWRVPSILSLTIMCQSSGAPSCTHHKRLKAPHCCWSKYSYKWGTTSSLIIWRYRSPLRLPSKKAWSNDSAISTETYPQGDLLPTDCWHQNKIMEDYEAVHILGHSGYLLYCSWKM